MSIVFDTITNEEGEEISVSFTLNNGLRVQVSCEGGDWECFDFESAEQAELVAKQLMEAAAAYRAEYP